MSAGTNRREGFRMDDVLRLRVVIPDPQDEHGILADFDAYRLTTCLQSHLRNQSEFRAPILQGIRKRDADVADYLQHLELQIVQLAAQLSSDSGPGFDDTHPELAVNLSSTGLRFPSAMDIEQGQTLELDIMLRSGTHLVALAEVLRVDDAGADSTDTGLARIVSTRFTRIHADDAEVITRHLARLQQLELQARREED